jgi:hypothetical protein
MRIPRNMHGVRRVCCCTDNNRWRYPDIPGAPLTRGRKLFRGRRTMNRDKYGGAGRVNNLRERLLIFHFLAFAKMLYGFSFLDGAHCDLRRDWISIQLARPTYAGEYAKLLPMSRLAVALT